MGSRVPTGALEQEEDKRQLRCSWTHTNNVKTRKVLEIWPRSNNVVLFIYYISMFIIKILYFMLQLLSS